VKRSAVVLAGLVALGAASLAWLGGCNGITDPESLTGLGDSTDTAVSDASYELAGNGVAVSADISTDGDYSLVGSIGQDGAATDGDYTLVGGYRPTGPIAGQVVGSVSTPLGAVPAPTADQP